MKNYLTKEEYDTYGLAEIDEAEFKALSIYATRLIDAYTFGAIDRESLLEDADYSQAIKEATAFQIDYMSRIGLEKAIGTETSGSISSENETIGNYSHSVSYRTESGGRSVYVGTARIAPLSVDLLSHVRALGRRLGRC